MTGPVPPPGPPIDDDRRWSARARRIARFGHVQLRREWRDGHLHLGDLPTGTRRLSVAAVILIVASAAIVVFDAFGWSIPGPVIEVVGSQMGTTAVVAIPLVPVFVCCAGLCVAAAALTLANRQSPRRLSRLVLAAIGFLGMSLGSQLVGNADALAGIERVMLQLEFTVPDPPASAIVTVGGWVAVVLGLVTAIFAVIPTRRIRTSVLAVLAAAPFGIVVILIAAVSYESFDLGPSGPAIGMPRILTASAIVVPSLMVVATIVGYWLVPIGLWQVVTWARAARRDVGGPVAAADGPWPWFLATLLTLKLGWLALGYTGWLPSSIGGTSPAWDRAAHDGVVAWFIAIALACAAGIWLASSRRPAVSERGFTPAAAIVVIGFSLVTAASSLLLLALPVAGLLGTSLPPSTTLETACVTSWAGAALGNSIRCLLDGATALVFEATVVVQLATLALALILAIAWRHRPGRRSMVLFFLAVVVWVAPRVPDVVGDLIDHPPAMSLAPELTTLDTALTAVLAVVAILWYTGRQRGAGPPAILLALTVATLITLPAAAATGAPASPIFLIALLFPIAYELLLDSEVLNRTRHDRPAKVAGSLGIRVGVLSLLSLGVVLGVDPSDAGWDQVGQVLFAVPFGALLVAATLSRPAFIAARVDGRQDADRARAPRVVGAGILTALVALAVVVGVGTAADTAFATDPGRPAASASPTRTPTPSPSPTASPLTRLAEFVGHVGAADARLQPLLTTTAEHLAVGPAQAAADGAALASFVVEERAWLAANTPATCYQSSIDAWVAQLNLLDALADGLGSLTPRSTPEAVTAALIPVDSLPAASDTFLETLDASASACGGGSPNPS